VVTLPASQLPAWLQGDAERTRGEFVLVLHARLQGRGDDASAVAPLRAAEALEPLRVLDTLLTELPLKQAVSLAARISGAPRNALYEAALKRRDTGAR